METLLKEIESTCKGKIRFQKKRPDLYQVYLPVYYEDGDMADVFLAPSENGNGSFLLKDCGTTLMRLSYTYEINTPAKETIFNKIIHQSGVIEKNGELCVESDSDQLFHSLMQLIGCQQKVLNMRMWQRETIRSLFLHDLDEFITTQMNQYQVLKNVTPLPEYDVIEVDYQLEYNGKKFFVFGVNSKDKAKNSTISLLEMQKTGLRYIGIIVHEAMDQLPRKDQMYLTQNADKQFVNLMDFQAKGDAFIRRVAA